MERRVQCLERIVREQQQEMERLIGIVLQSNTGLVQPDFQHAALTASANQNFYFHDEIIQPVAATRKQPIAATAKSPTPIAPSWENQVSEARFVDVNSKVQKGVHSFTRALPVTHVKSKTKAMNRVPLKHSRAVNAVSILYLRYAIIATPRIRVTTD